MSRGLPGAVDVGIAVDPSTGRLAVTRDGGVLVLEDDGTQVADHAVDIKGISRPRWSPDGTLLAVGGADGTVRIYG